VKKGMIITVVYAFTENTRLSRVFLVGKGMTTGTFLFVTQLSPLKMIKWERTKFSLSG